MRTRNTKPLRDKVLVHSLGRESPHLDYLASLQLKETAGTRNQPGRPGMKTIFRSCDVLQVVGTAILLVAILMVYLFSERTRTEENLRDDAVSNKSPNLSVPAQGDKGISPSIGPKFEHPTVVNVREFLPPTYPLDSPETTDFIDSIIIRDRFPNFASGSRIGVRHVGSSHESMSLGDAGFNTNPAFPIICKGF